MQIFKKISEGLKKTSKNFGNGINDIFNKSKPSNEILQDLEDFMIASDIGLPLTEKIIENIKNKKFSDEELNQKNFLEILTNEMLEILEPVEENIFNKFENEYIFSDLVCHKDILLTDFQSFLLM